MKKERLEELSKYIKNGGDLRRLTSSEVITLQEYALNIGDVDLYDDLEIYWG